jgi:RimJ/RimL family protein N-acetyltransferase
MKRQGMIKIAGFNDRARKLLAFTPLQYMIEAVTENEKLAQIFVDDENMPECCAMLLGHYLFIGGELTEDFLRALVGTLFTKEKREQMEAVIVFYENETTAGYFRRFFDKVYDSERSLYHQKPVLHEKEDGFSRIIPINWELLDSKMQNLSMITDEVLGTATYNDMKDFCDRGIGFTYASDNMICSFCTSEYPCIYSVAIGIEVSKEHQRQGIATEMAKAFLQSAAKRDLDVYWECWKKNEASAKTALTCGFHKIADYPVLFIDLV